MRFFTASAGVGAVVLLSMVALAAGQQDHADCDAPYANAGRAIAGCARIIEDAKEPAEARAAAYYNRGNAYSLKKDSDHALADYSAAIQLKPNADTYNNRGVVYQAKGDNERAFADFGEAIRLVPDYSTPYYNRGKILQAMGDNDHAIADYSEAIRLFPQEDEYLHRGITYYSRGSFVEAMDDFRQAADRDPKHSYYALWLDIAERRNGLPSHLAERAKQLDMTAWPAPVVLLFLGEMRPLAVLTLAGHEDAKTQRDQMCEANFYSGEFLLLQGQKQEALPFYQAAAKDCPREFTEWSAANAALRALSAAH